MANITAIEYARALKRNQYPDSDSKRLHLKGIDAAQRYLSRPTLVKKIIGWLDEASK